MASSVRAICKNTFISLVVEDADDSIPTSLTPSPRLSTRSRSAECLRSRPDADEFGEVTQQSLQTLNAMLSKGEQSKKPANIAVSQSSDVPACESQASCEELRSLQGKLAKALAGKSNSLQQKPLLMKTWDNQMRVSSSCSLSTMAPDDASDGEPSFSGLRRIGKVASSGSVSTMVSDWADMLDEDDEVEFELDIEAGAKAALKEDASARHQPVPVAVSACSANRGPGAVTPEMSHSQVPRNQNMAQMYDSKRHEAPTTMMIRNIPGRYSQNDLMMDLQDLGLAGTYDFLYIPMDKSTAANVGYAFVNFINAWYAERCVEAFANYRFNRHQRSSTKIASVSVAHLQGLEKNLQHYENAAVNMARDKRRRPVVVPNIGSMLR